MPHIILHTLLWRYKSLPISPFEISFIHKQTKCISFPVTPENSYKFLDERIYQSTGVPKRVCVIFNPWRDWFSFLRTYFHERIQLSSTSVTVMTFLWILSRLCVTFLESHWNISLIFLQIWHLRMQSCDKENCQARLLYVSSRGSLCGFIAVSQVSPVKTNVIKIKGILFTLNIHRPVVVISVVSVPFF